MPSVLLVDDDEDTRALLAIALAKRGFEVAQARSVADAVERFRAWPTDVLVIDLGLPDGHGADVLRLLGSGAPPAIALTGRDPEPGPFRAHLVKPVTVAALADALRKLLQTLD